MGPYYLEMQQFECILTRLKDKTQSRQNYILSLLQLNTDHYHEPSNTYNSGTIHHCLNWQLTTIMVSPDPIYCVERYSVQNFSGSAIE